LVVSSAGAAQPYVGEIRIFAGNFAPAGWEFCQGQLLPIAENETLFQLIGTTYGGDGESTFALPDLRGRAPIHQGNGYILGETGGVEAVTLTIQQIPVHSHITPGATVGVPSPSYFSKALLNNQELTISDTDITRIAKNSWSTGGSQPHENMQPYLVVNYIISLFGVFPSPT